MATSYHDQQRLRGLLYQTEGKFAAWEALALLPKNVNPSEWQDRLRVAQTIHALRCGREPDLAEFVVLAELRKLILKQTKAKNAISVYEPEEIETIETNLQTRSDWSELLRWLKNVRKETDRRYNERQSLQRLAA
ncbi:hypothetical protein [Hymenobacter fodinae]|uniref:Uncharacterized protein n=1 Tax=Hymenobacter fodinae TaxID=2510796 RepID=A0A4Z0P2M3_9BACT|nr:hypothetical protein [Hymenobacter fodinae]TGE05604.1 hypothetical protein EU556_20090 [Hymenobacter fodinae]